MDCAIWLNSAIKYAVRALLDRMRRPQLFLPLRLVEGLEQRLALSAAPVVLSINRSAPAALVTAATTVTYSVTFSKPVTGVDPTDFQLSLNGVTASAPVSVSGSGAVYTVTVNGISGNGTLGLNLGDNNSIRDLAGQPLVQPNAPVTFAAATTWAAGQAPSSVVATDVNGDGKPDIIVANPTSNTVSVLLGNGDGTFKPPVAYPAGSNPTSVAVADLNGDNKPDLVVANFVTAGTVTMLLGKGDGTFQPGTVIATGKSPRGVTVADVNKDGKPDVLVANAGTSTVGELLGNGNGTFQPEQPFTTGTTTAPFVIAAADINGDGNPDVVTCNNYDSSVSVLLGSGTGTFQAPLSSAATYRPSSIAIADLNGDGKSDILVGSSVYLTSLLIGNGDGTFQPRTLFNTTGYGVAVADVNGDGVSDAVVTGPVSRHALEVLLGHGDGTFNAPVILPAGPDRESITIADVNGDGRPDLVVANYGDGTAGSSFVSVFLGAAHGGFTGQLYTIEHPITTVQSIVGSAPAGTLTNAGNVAYTVTFSGPVTGVDVADFSLSLSGTVAGDIAGVIPVSSSVYTVNIASITGTGTLGLSLRDDGTIHDSANHPIGSSNASFAASSSWAAGGQAISVATADVNGDGKLDLLTDTVFGLSILLGNGDGTFQPETTIRVTSPSVALVVADINGDGRPDAVLSGGYRNNNVIVLIGNGDGTFQTPRLFPAGNRPVSVAVADVNGDGRPDLVVADHTTGGQSTVSVLLGSGAGTFLSPLTYLTATGLSSVAVADVNGDGRPDLVVADSYANTVGVLLGGDNGTFQPEIALPAGKHPISVAVADINQDGNPDIVVANRDSNTVGLMLGNGNGTFHQQVSFPVGAGPHSVSVADCNGDGLLDVIVSNYSLQIGTVTSYSSNTIGVLIGNGDGSFRPQQTFGVGSKPAAIATGDINGDGRPDLIAANYGDSTVSVLLGSGGLGGQVYTVNRVAPAVASISRLAPAGPLVNTTSVMYAVTFTEPVTGVDPTDFSLALNGVTASDPLTVSGSGAAYTVAVDGISGAGTLGLNLVDDNSIRDSAGNRLARGNGAFLFAAQPVVSTGANPYSITSADVNGDGRPDLVVANRAGGSVSVLLGKGDGTFQPQLNFAVGTYPMDVAVSDVNGDGMLDIITANWGSSSVSVLLGNGDGTFLPQMVIPVAKPGGLKLADVNGDGKPDLLVAAIYSGVEVHLGNGDGTFQPARTFPAALGPNFLVTGDFNGDGKPDVLASGTSTNIALLLGNGDGTFQYPRTFNPSFGAGAAIALVPADINGDGRLDIIEADSVDRRFTVLLGNGDGTFGPPQSTPTGGSPNSLVVADLNGDGRADLALSPDFAAPQIAIFPGIGNGTFKPQQTFALTTGASRLISADLNEDGRPDLLVLNYYTSSVRPLLNIANGDFTGDVYAINSATPAVNAFAMTGGVEGTATPPVIGSFTGQPQDAFTATVDYGDGGGPKSVALNRNNFTLSNAYPEAGTYTVTVVVTDTTAGLVSAPVTATVTVADAAVVATITGAPATIALGGSVNLNFTATNPNKLEMGPLVESWTIRDGSSAVVASGTGGPYTFTPAAVGTYTVTFTAGESAAADSETGTATATITVNPAAPTLTSTAIDDGSKQRSLIRSLTFSFSSPVTLSAGAITLALLNTAGSNSGTNDGSPPTDASAALGVPTSPDGGLTWVVPIQATSARSALGSLTDGIYSATVHASLVTDSYGQPLSGGDPVKTFHRLFGDVNGDKRVNATDYQQFSAAFGSSNLTANYSPYFDFNHDGRVNATDYQQFSSRFGKSLVYTG